LLRFFALLACVAGCSVNSPGGGSEAGNGLVVGNVIAANGKPAAGAQVALVASSFNPVTGNIDSAAFWDTTDARGGYRFKVAKPGSYNILALQFCDHTRFSIWNLAVGSQGLTVPPDTLSIPGSVKIQLQAGTIQSNGYIYIPGTGIRAGISAGSCSVTLDSIPAGILPSVCYAAANGSDSSVIRYAIPVISSDTVAVVRPSWKYARRLYLNTSAGGAGITGNVYGFPILVRLTAGNFIFSQAQPGGADLQFTKLDNTPLPYEIERWDSVSGMAEVWVKTDTIFGNIDSQFVYMYWGNPSAQAGSNGAAVFDTGNGFTGVWHMNENPAGGTGSIKDRTANGLNATPLGGMTGADLVTGAIGMGLHFNGVSDALYVGQITPDPHFSLSLWVFSNSLGSYQRFIANQSGYTLWYDSDKQGLRVEYHDSTIWRGIPQDGGTVQPMTVGAWYYLTGTFDGNITRLYVNGTQATASNSIGTGIQLKSDSLILGDAWHIGFVNGIMDEIRIEKVARSADWVRLSYMNQKPVDQLVVFGQ
jgi:hypothetical protein